ncbi:hypothetical protein F2P56_011072 [Juglans regia]|uniref:Reverse transcriptase Ty1/copia-type domain-containing protein n=2 Tax=Juglans regia TaxID=51240 RepID=A0A834D057_JUGRE|nr:uncharacterized mitochondrial protein AtMg00810-like [Juglans regia]KAF5470568.1 hypothetical protein F2P56_011072 [Juglans regia]
MAQLEGFEDPAHPNFSSQVDPSLFTYHQDTVHAFLLVYVDDILVTSNDRSFVASLISKLQLDFVMKDLGQLSYFLGIEATCDSSSLHLRQKRYVIHLLDLVKLLGIHPYRAPYISGSKLSKFDGKVLLGPLEYRHTVGALQYVTLTRPDIAFSLNKLCQHMQASTTTTHWTTAKRVLHYLNNTLDYGLFYTPGSFSINAYCDSDWDGDPDDRRLMCGYGIYVGPNLISWSAKNQPVVFESSTEAEYRCLALVTAEVYWLRMRLCEL